MVITIVVAMTKNRAIGHSGSIPWNLPGDLRHFKSITIGNSIIMGRKTFDSIGFPLPQRRNIVITRNLAFAAECVEVATSLEDALLLCKKTGDKEVMIIGGGEIYRQVLPLAQKIHLTQIHASIAGDTFFPKLNLEDWVEVSSELQKNLDGPNYSFIVFERRKLENGLVVEDLKKQ